MLNRWKRRANRRPCTTQTLWYATGPKLSFVFVLIADLSLRLRRRNRLRPGLASMAGPTGLASLLHLPAREILKSMKRSSYSIPCVLNRTSAISSANTCPGKPVPRRNPAKPGVWPTTDLHPIRMSSAPFQTGSFATTAIRILDSVRITRFVSCVVAKKTSMSSHHPTLRLRRKPSQQPNLRLHKRKPSLQPNLRLQKRKVNALRDTLGTLALIPATR